MKSQVVIWVGLAEFDLFDCQLFAMMRYLIHFWVSLEVKSFHFHFYNSLIDI